MADPAAAAAVHLPTRADEDWRYVDLTPLNATLVADPAPKIQHHGAGESTTLPNIAVLSASDPTCSDPTYGWASNGATLALRLGGTDALALDLHGAGLSGFRIHLDIAAGAQVSLRLRHHGSGAHRLCSWISIHQGAGSMLRITEHDATAIDQRLSAWQVRLERDAQLSWTSASNGGALLRCRLDVDLAASGAGLDGACIDQPTDGRQSHRVFRIHHAAPHTTSALLAKAVVGTHSRASADGLIRVAVGADGTNADYQQRNLLMSDDAKAFTRPQLDIKADDVKAGHGATIGQLDADELLYLRMRGLPMATARGLLADGFVREVTNRLV